MQKLEEVVARSAEEELNELEKEGVIQRFEYTYELAWQTLQDLFRFKGFLEISGPNPVLSQAFKDGLIKNGDGWRKIKISRNLTSHTYNSETAEEIAQNIVDDYFHLFKGLEVALIHEMKFEHSGLF